MPTAQYQDPFGVTGDAYNTASNTALSNLGALGYNVQLSNTINAQNQAMQQQANASRLGPQGQQTQQNLLDVAQNQSQGLLDPATEQMLQAGIAANGMASGMGVDSPNLASAYRRALGQDISTTEAQGQSNYLALLAANPSAPIYDMSGQLVSPQTYSTTAQSQAALQQQAQLAAQQLAAQQAAAQQSAAARSAPRNVPTAAEANTVPFGGGGGVVSNAPIGWSPDASSYSGSGGSSVFGTVGGQDMFDPTGLFSGAGSMPNYSSPGTDPIAAALGMGSSDVPSNTDYNQAANTYTTNYGVPDYYSAPASTDLTYNDWANTFGGG